MANGISTIGSEALRRGDAEVRIAETRARQTQPGQTVFGDVLATAAQVAMSGARVATHVLGVPELAAAIPAAAATAATTTGGAVSGVAGVAAAAPGGELATMAAMQRESQTFNLQLLELQEQVQQENRRFTTLSNVLRAKHDTAKAAVSNIRS